MNNGNGRRKEDSSLQIALLSWESKHSIAVGGVAAHVSELAAALVKRGHDAHVFTRVGPGQRTYDRIDGVHYHRCPYNTHPDFLVDVSRMCDSFVWHIGEAESYLGRTFDIVHGHDWMTVPALRQAKNDRNSNVVMTMHSTEFGRCGNQLWEGQSRRIRDLEWEGTFLATKLICVSGALRSEVGWLYQVPIEKTRVIYNGVEVEKFDTPTDVRSVRARYAIGADDPLVLFAGRLTWQKGPDLLLDALPDLLYYHPRAKFLFAGDGDMRTGLEKKAESMGLRSASRFVGYRSGQDLVDLFKTADMVCVPSRNEPFGIVILEAWSAGKPVIATRNGGPAEFVKHQDNGLTVFDNKHSIGWGVGTALADQRAATQMGRKGRQYAEERFDWHKIAAETDSVYATIAQSVDSAHALGSSQGKEDTAMARKIEDGANQKPKAARPARTPAKGKPQADMCATPTPTEEMIRRRAYEIFVNRGGTPGDPMADWLQAERELREANGNGAVRR